MLKVTIALKGGAIVKIDASRFVVRTHRASGKIMGYEWRVLKDDVMESQLLYLDLEEIAAIVARQVDSSGVEGDEVHAIPDGGSSDDPEAVRATFGA